MMLLMMAPSKESCLDLLRLFWLHPGWATIRLALSFCSIGVCCAASCHVACKKVAHCV